MLADTRPLTGTVAPLLQDGTNLEALFLIGSQ